MTPRAAATTMLMRDAAGQLQLLMVRRSPAARFMGGHWVFPGGAVEPADGPGQAGLRAAALRELAEETGIALAPDQQIVPFARWITPEQMPVRYDTWFYLALSPPGAQPSVDGSEIVEFRWVTATEALARSQAGEFQLAFPTRKQLEQLSQFPSAERLLDHARARVEAIRPVQPRVVGTGEQARIVLPGED